MITGIRIGGFKPFPFSVPAEISLAPITLFVGPNSAGKSSVVQALLAMAQSWAHSIGSIATLTTSAKLVDAGKFSRALHLSPEGKREDTMEVGLQLDGKYWSRFRWMLPSADSPVGTLSGLWLSTGDIELEFRVSEILAPDYFVACLQPSSLQQWAPAVEALGDLLPAVTAPTAYLELRLLVSDDVKEEDALFVDWYSGPQDSELGQKQLAPSLLDDEIRTRVKLRALERISAALGDKHGALRKSLAGLLAGLRNLRQHLSRIAHVGATRERGKRIYLPNTCDDPKRVGSSGERVVDVVLSAMNRGVDVQALVSDYLRAIDFNYALRILTTGVQSPAAELFLSPLAKDPYSSDSTGADEDINGLGLMDVGSGISQILPVLVQVAVYRHMGIMRHGGAIYVEQPEIHLHPRAQAQFASLLADWSKNMGEEELNVQMILETHSEILIDALASLVKDDVLLVSDLSAVRFRRRTSGWTSCDNLRWEEARDLRKSMADFFPERRMIALGELPTFKPGQDN